MTAEREARPAELRARGLEAVGLGGRGQGRPEPWAWLAFALLAALAGAFVYLGSRPGGRGPIWVWAHGRFLLAGLAVVVLAWGGVRGLRRRPVLQRHRGRALLAAVLVIGVAPFPFPYPSSREGRPSPVAFRLPVEGPWLVVQGGEGREHNLFAALTHDRRWGLALVPADGEPALGRPVLAAAAGRVVRVRDGVPDDLPRNGPPPDGPPPDGAPPPAHGNLVVIEVAEGEYLFTAHLRAGSIRVAEGQRVAAGDVLGAVGRSGRAPLVGAAHVAVHLQTSPDDGWGEGIPWRFRDYRADGRAVPSGLPRGGGPAGARGGQRVEQP